MNYLPFLLMRSLSFADRPLKPIIVPENAEYINTSDPVRIQVALRVFTNVQTHVILHKFDRRISGEQVNDHKGFGGRRLYRQFTAVLRQLHVTYPCMYLRR
jgi:hypothetical protein